MAKTQSIERVLLGGQKVAVLSQDEMAEQMLVDYHAVKSADPQDIPLPKLVFSANGEGISYAASNDDFNALMQQADIIHADGMPLVVASRLLTKNPLPERVATTDLVHACSRKAAKHGLRYFIIGAEPENIKKAEANLKKMYPGLNIVGTYPFFKTPEEEAKALAAVQAAKPDVVWLGLGRLRQEATAIRWRNKLRGVTWIKTCGGLFGFLSGSKPRAPQWMQNAGLEWFYRMMSDPKRLFYRYATTNVHAIWLLLTRTRTLNDNHKGVNVVRFSA